MKPTRIALLLLVTVTIASQPANAQQTVEIRSPKETIEFFKSRAFWGPEKRGKTLQTPRAYTVRVAKSFDKVIRELPVSVKKELFYRSALPLILVANEEIMADRKRVLALGDGVKGGTSLPADDRAWLRRLAAAYEVDAKDADLADADSAVWRELATRVDVIPPSLALGQAAYESAYGGSRFALHGNAYFGIWTWGEKGMVPKEQRSGKGSYKVASYDAPLESIQAYAKNLNTHRAYSMLRDKRAELRSQGKPLSGPVLAGGLLKYSERGESYVETLRGIIEFNDLEIADDAVLRDEPPVLLMEVEMN